jgi:hypothetical protein
MIHAAIFDDQRPPAPDRFIQPCRKVFDALANVAALRVHGLLSGVGAP